MNKRIMLAAFVLSGFTVTATCEPVSHDALLACEDAWRARSRSEIPPGPDDTHDPRNGKSLSQSDGAKRTRDQKLQAFKNAMTLECIKDKANLAR